MNKLWESTNGDHAIVVTAAIHRGEVNQPYFANHVQQCTTIKLLDLYQVMRAAGQVETVLGLTAHTKYEKPKKELNPQQTLFDKSSTGALGVPTTNDNS